MDNVEKGSRIEIGARIKELRIKKKMNCNELANKAGVSPTYIYQLEKGIKSPTVEYLSFICDALNVTLCDFFRSDDTKEKEIFDTLSPEQKKRLNDFLESLIG